MTASTLFAAMAKNRHLDARYGNVDWKSMRRGIHISSSHEKVAAVKPAKSAALAVALLFLVLVRGPLAVLLKQI